MKGLLKDRPFAPGGRVASNRSPDFWRDAFHLRTDDQGAVLCPELFRAVAEDILEAGKAALLLRTEHRCLVLATSPDVNCSHALHSCVLLPRILCSAPAGHQLATAHRANIFYLALAGAEIAHHSLQQLLVVHPCMQRCSGGFVVRCALAPHSVVDLVYPCMADLHHQAVCPSYTLQVHADGNGGSAPVHGTIADSMATLAAGPFDRRLNSLTLQDNSAACETGISNCGTDNTLFYELPRADNIMAHSLTAESLQQPRSSDWHLSRFLSMGSAQGRAGALHDATWQPSSLTCSPGRQLSTHENQTLSSQQENQAIGSLHPHPQQAQATHKSYARHHSAGILGDVSNVFPIREQGAKDAQTQSSPAVLQAALAKAEVSQVGNPSDAQLRPPPETEASATHTVDSRADASDQPHGLRQADDLLKEWYHRCAVHSSTCTPPAPTRCLQVLFYGSYGKQRFLSLGYLTCSAFHRTMEGICSASSLPAAAQEPESMKQFQRTGSQRLHSVLVAAHTGQSTMC